MLRRRQLQVHQLDFAVAIAHAEIGQLVLLDLFLGRDNGLDILPQILAYRPNLPVVIFSGFAYKGAIDTALAMGARSFIAKPAEFEGWQAIVHQIWEFGLENLRDAHVAI